MDPEKCLYPPAGLGPKEKLPADRRKTQQGRESQQKQEADVQYKRIKNPGWDTL